MKFLHLRYLCLLLALGAAHAQDAAVPTTAAPGGGTNSVPLPADTAFQVVDLGANHRTWQRKTYEQGPNGKTITHFHKYTELATGMNYRDGQGKWVESQELIEPFHNGAVARHGRHQVIFAPDLNSQGSIALQMPDGQSMGINVLGLAFYDSSSGNSVMLGQVQDSQGELVSSNVVLYPNAFTGVNADVRYTYRRGGFEQDVILRGQLPDPTSFGLNPETTKLEVMTEFLNPPPEKITDRSNFKHPSQDEDVSWGSMLLGHGKAFDLGDQKPYWDGTLVDKRYITSEDGRKILLEMVPWKNVSAKTSHLPKQAGIQQKKPVLMAKNPPLPSTPAPKSALNPIKLASAAPPNNGYVLDYVLLNTDTSDFTFQGDTTYLIYGGVSFSGTTIFEGGTCIKSSSSIGSQLQLYGPAVCKASEYHPIVFTSQDDNSVGESIGSGTPSIALNEFSMDASGDDVVMEHIRCSYCDVGVHPTCNTFRLTDAQFYNCYRPICPEYVNCQFNNVLIVNCVNVFWGGLYTVEASHFTVDGCQQFTDGWDDSSDDNITITNSLLVAINSFGNAPVATDHTIQLASDVGIFQSAGSGGYYLAPDSPYRGSGTINIDPGFLADIATKTTYPPVIYSNITISSAVTYSPQAPRDNSGTALDLGYHYDPLDYCFGGVIANANLNFMAGTAVGWFQLPGSGGPGFGISLNANVTAAFNGTPAQPCVFAFHDTVQEGGNGLWTDRGWLAGLEDGGDYQPSSPSQVTASFTHFFVLDADPNHIRDGVNGQPISVQAWHCEFYGAFGGYNILGNYTNCLFYRGGTGIATSETYPYQRLVNCTFYGGQLNFNHWESAAPYWYSLVQNCSFDQNTSFGIDDPFGVNTAYANYNYNAFLQGAPEPPTEGAQTITVSTFNWQTGPLGSFYLPAGSPLIDQGNGTAGQVGLYSYTTQTSQALDGNSPVDIGYHYYALTLIPSDVTITYGNNAIFSVDSGEGLHYQWQKIVNGVPQNVGEDSASYTVVNPSVADSGAEYNVIVYNNSWSQTSPQVTLTVNPAPLTITAQDQGKTYGGTLTFGSGSTQFLTSGLQNSETVGTVTLACNGGGSTAAAGAYPITPSAATGGTFNPANYTVSYVNGRLGVFPASLTVTANNQTKNYGGALTFGSGSTQFASSGLKNGETIGTVTLACNGGGATAAAGSYAITPSAATGGTFNPANYFLSYNNGTLTVNPAPLAITANNQTKLYGATLTFGSGSTQFTSSGLQNGETIGTVTLGCSGGGTTTSVGAYAIMPSAATGGTFSPANYTITYNNGSLTVNPASLTITANAQSKTYGTTQTSPVGGSTAFSSAGLQNGDTVGSVTLNFGAGGLTATAPAGSTSTITPSAATGGTFNANNYSITYNNGTLTVSPAALTVTANNQTKTYGTSSSFTSGSAQFTSSGLQNGETIGTVTLACSGGVASAVAGTYSITPSAATGGTFNVNNYSVTYNNGTLTVNPAALTVTANNQTKTYGASSSFTSGSTQFTSSGLQNGETIGTVTLACSGGAASAAAGTYSITPSAATGGTFNVNNYSVTYNNGTLTVNRAALTVTANNQTKTYGASSSFTSGSTQFTSSGLQNSETIGTVTLACSGGAGSAAAGTYSITPSAATGGTFNVNNYSVTYNNGTLTVNPAALTVTANNQSKTYGASLPFTSGSTQFFSSGLQNGETIGTVTLACGGGGTGAAAGAYAITPSAAIGGTFNPANYTVSYNNGTLTVNPAALTVTANNQTKTYGQTLNFGSGSTQFTSSGLQNSETIGTVTLACSGGGAGAAGGTYLITPSAATGGTFNPANYTISYVNGTLTVIPLVSFQTTTLMASEYGPVSTVFTVTRTGTQGPLTVYFQTPTGTAVPGADYVALPSSVTIPDGSSSATVTLTPIQNGGVDTETVVLTLATSTSYGTGTGNSATCNIVDSYGDTDGDGLADAMEAAFGCNPLVANPTWNQDSDGDGIPDTYQAMVGSADQPTPGLPSYSMCPVP